MPTFQEALAASLRQGELQGQQIGMQKGQQIGMQKGQQIGLQKGQQIGMQKGQQKGALHNEHRIVLRQLQRKFNQIPDSIVQQIETSSDLDQLDKWLDQIIVAKDLSDIVQIFKT